MSCARPTLFFMTLCLLVAIGRCNLELKLLHVLFRHGDKVPHREYQNYPTDPHNNHSYYPFSSGDLTNLGKMREYKVGLMLRERYDRYFGPDYWPSMIYARSTEIPRTQASLQLVLAGLFPPSPRQTWNPRLPWNPTAMFFKPLQEDYLLFPHYCRQYKEEYSRLLHRRDTLELINSYRKVMDYLTEHSGKQIDTTSDVYYLYNLLKEESAQNLSLPKWTEKVYPSPMKEITALDFNLRSYTTTLKRLNGGLVLRKIVNDIEDLRADNLYPSDRKAFLFSAHEVNVVALARTLDMKDPVLPPYGSSIILETYLDEKGIYYVRVLLWTGVTEELIVQHIPGCTEFCPFEEFIKVFRDVLPNDDEYNCRSNIQDSRQADDESHSKSPFDSSAATNLLAEKTTIYSIVIALFVLLRI